MKHAKALQTLLFSGQREQVILAKVIAKQLNIKLRKVIEQTDLQAFEFTKAMDFVPELRDFQIYCPEKNIKTLRPLLQVKDINWVSLNVSFNELKDIKPLSKLTTLYDLECNDNDIKDLKPLRKVENLAGLSCSGNKIKSLKPLQELTNLDLLYCDGNFIEDLKPLRKLHRLQHLDISFNPITNLDALQDLESLEYLDCSYTWINSLEPVLNLMNLKQLCIRNTYVSKKERKFFQQMHPDCEVIY